MPPTEEESERIEEVLDEREPGRIGGWVRVDPQDDVSRSTEETLVQWNDSTDRIAVFVSRGEHTVGSREGEDFYTAGAAAVGGFRGFESKSLAYQEETIREALDAAIDYMERTDPAEPIPTFSLRMDGGMLKPLGEFIHRLGAGNARFTVRNDGIHVESVAFNTGVDFTIQPEHMEAFEVESEGAFTVDSDNLWDMLGNFKFGDEIPVALDGDEESPELGMGQLSRRVSLGVDYTERSFPAVGDPDFSFTADGINFQDVIRTATPTRGRRREARKGSDSSPPPLPDYEAAAIGVQDGVALFQTEAENVDVEFTVRFDTSEVAGEGFVSVDVDPFREFIRALPRPSQNDVTVTAEFDTPLLVESMVSRRDRAGPGIDVRTVLSDEAVPMDITIPPAEIIPPDEVAAQSDADVIVRVVEDEIGRLTFQAQPADPEVESLSRIIPVARVSDFVDDIGQRFDASQFAEGDIVAEMTVAGGGVQEVDTSRGEALAEPVEAEPEQPPTDEPEAPPPPPEEKEPEERRETIIVSLIGGSPNYNIPARVPGKVEDEAVQAALDTLGPPGQFDVNDEVGAVAFRGTEVTGITFNRGRTLLAETEAKPEPEEPEPEAQPEPEPVPEGPQAEIAVREIVGTNNYVIEGDPPESVTGELTQAARDALGPASQFGDGDVVGVATFDGGEVLSTTFRQGRVLLGEEPPPEPEPEVEPEPAAEPETPDDDQEDEIDDSDLELSRSEIETIAEGATLGVTASAQIVGNRLQELRLNVIEGADVRFVTDPETITAMAADGTADTIRSALERWEEFVVRETISEEQVEGLNEARRELSQQFGIDLPSFAPPMAGGFTADEIEAMVERGTAGVDATVTIREDIDSLRIAMEEDPRSDVEFVDSIAEAQGPATQPTLVINEAYTAWAEAVNMDTVDQMEVTRDRQDVEDEFDVDLFVLGTEPVETADETEESPGEVTVEEFTERLDSAVVAAGFPWVDEVGFAAPATVEKAGGQFIIRPDDDKIDRIAEFLEDAEDLKRIVVRQETNQSAGDVIIAYLSELTFELTREHSGTIDFEAAQDALGARDEPRTAAEVELEDKEGVTVMAPRQARAVLEAAAEGAREEGEPAESGRAFIRRMKEAGNQIIQNPFGNPVIEVIAPRAMREEVLAIIEKWDINPRGHDVFGQAPSFAEERPDVAEDLIAWEFFLEDAEDLKSSGYDVASIITELQDEPVLFSVSPTVQVSLT